MIHVKAPTRIDICGGTLDCWPLHLLVPRAITINVAVGIYANVEIHELGRTSSQVNVDVVDLGVKKEFSNLQALLQDGDPALALIQEVCRALPPRKGVRIKTYSESPVGAGLGGSSAMTIALIKALCRFNGIEVRRDQVHRWVELAHNLEARVLLAPTGTQDYVPAYMGGMNALHYLPRGLRIEPLNIDLESFCQNFTLIYTGRPHHSGLNNWQVIKSAIEKDAKTLSALRDIGRLSEEIYTCIQEGEWKQLPRLLEQESEARVRLSPGFTSPEIENLRFETKKHGADAVKICGAGGGGCVLVWADPNRRDTIRKECLKNGLRELPLSPVGPSEKHSWASIEVYSEGVISPALP
jgi:D-glycero-alpha-D-manno-heptose-7-phosphate kinase